MSWESIDLNLKFCILARLGIMMAPCKETCIFKQVNNLWVRKFTHFLFIRLSFLCQSLTNFACIWLLYHHWELKINTQKVWCLFTLILINCSTHLGSQSMQTSPFRLLGLAPYFDCITLSMMYSLTLSISKESFLCLPLKSHLFYLSSVRFAISTN